MYMESRENEQILLNVKEVIIPAVILWADFLHLQSLSVYSYNILWEGSIT